MWHGFLKFFLAHFMIFKFALVALGFSFELKNIFNDSDETAQSVDDGAPTPAISDDDISAQTASNDAPMSDEPQEANDTEANASDGVTQTDDKSDEDTKAPTS